MPLVMLCCHGSSVMFQPLRVAGFWMVPTTS
jgi:hypothetical protein